MSDTQDIANLPIGGDNLPKSVRTAVEYLAHQAAKECNLKHGQTALFWNLVMTVERHIRSVKGGEEGLQQG